MGQLHFCGITLSEADKIIREDGFGDRNALKVVTNFYRRRIYEFSGMDNIPKSLREFLDSRYSPGLFKPVKSEKSRDKSEKYLFSGDSGKVFETVVIPDKKRRTVCLSTQSGCRMGCPFCLTGKAGFKGDLTCREIINQVLSVPGSAEIDHIVFMGMGEPMDNLAEVLKACEIITSGWGLSISSRNVTVSTVGITPEVRRFIDDTSCNLTLSLFSPFPDERVAVVPAEKLYPAAEIIEIMKGSPLLRKRRFSIAYVMIRDVNDTIRHLDGLVHLLEGTEIRINILPYHEVPHDSFASSPLLVMEAFKNSLLAKGISASIRKSRGADISAACGLLATGLRL